MEDGLDDGNDGLVEPGMDAELDDGLDEGDDELEGLDEGDEELEELDEGDEELEELDDELLEDDELEDELDDELLEDDELDDCVGGVTHAVRNIRIVPSRDSVNIRPVIFILSVSCSRS